MVVKSMKTKKQSSCPVCLCNSGAYYWTAEEFKLFKCQDCGLEYTYPIPPAAQLREFYLTYTDIRATSNVVRLNARRNLNSLKNFGYAECKTILDFGTGEGDFVKIAGENSFGIDFKKGGKTRVYEKFSDLPIKSYDFITLWGVLEHLANPVKTLLELGIYAKSGAIIAITTVDAEATIPYYYKPVEHLTYWTKSSLNHMFKKTGLELIEYKPYFMLQSSEIYISRLLSRTPLEYKSAFDGVINILPEYVEVPTNEVFVVAKNIK
jgi:hypothetical protein